MKYTLTIFFLSFIFSCQNKADSDLQAPIPDPALNNAIVFWRPNPNGGIFTIDNKGENETKLLALPDNSTIANPSWSPDNSIYFTGKLHGDKNPQLYSMQVDGSQLRRITNNLTAAYSHLNVALNTDLLYIKTLLDGSKQVGLYFSKADGTQEKKVLDLSEFTLSDATWSSSANTIIYVSDEVKNANSDPVSNIFEMAVDGTNKQQLTKNQDKNKVYAHPHTLGESMVYTATPNVNTTGYQVYLSSLDGSQEKLLLPALSKAEDWKDCTWFLESLVSYNWYPSDDFNEAEGSHSTGTGYTPRLLVTDHQHKLYVVSPDGLYKNQVMKTSSFDAKAKNFY